MRYYVSLQKRIIALINFNNISSKLIKYIIIALCRLDFLVIYLDLESLWDTYGLATLFSLVLGEISFIKNNVSS